MKNKKPLRDKDAKSLIINFFATFRLCGFLKEDIRNEIKKEIQI